MHVVKLANVLISRDNPKINTLSPFTNRLSVYINCKPGSHEKTNFRNLVLIFEYTISMDITIG